ncbi:MAG: T9SS type A sorting domain-containing protein, partial [Flavobacteriales bacterium]|nr:T9SS type A sorting domain-containing protein [Flavobacteriales bacterium]
PGTNNDTWLNAIRPLSYQLWFENVDTATAPASEVRLIDTLDLTVYDPQTFRATGFGVNDRMWSIPQDRMSHHEIVDLRPEVPVLVKVDVDFNETDGVIHVVYTALDTLTLQPEEDPDLGFLPPNINSPEGIGWFSFDVALRTGLEQGEAISNHAAIYFDYNAPVITEDWTNWFDDEPPFSSFTMGNISNTESVEVTWSAGDEDAGLNHIEIYITEIVDGTPLTYLWQTFGADVFSTTYEGSFGDQVTYSIIAYDNAGNVQSEPSVAEVSIVTSLSDLDSGTFEVVPNPAMDVVRITAPIGTESLRVLDLTGRVMFETGINASQFNLDLGFLSGGLYMVECTAGRYSQRIPLVMQ